MRAYSVARPHPSRREPSAVMAGLGPAIHVFAAASRKTWLTCARANVAARRRAAFVIPIHFSNSHTSSFPRRMSAPGLLHPCFAKPPIEGWRSAERRSGAAAPVGHAMTRRVRRLRGALRPIARQDARERAYDAGRSPLGAPPWRFWVPGPRFFTGICAGSVTASCSHPGRSAWTAGSRASRGQRLPAAAAGRHASLRSTLR